MPVSVLAAFFASGFAALLYQIVWQRMLGIFSGADVQSATIVIAAFMAGLGSGSLGGGHLADRVSRRTSLVLFGVAELAIATFGVWSSTLFYGVLYERVGRLGLGMAPTAAILFAALIVPTFCMGMSLPLLARGVTKHVDRAASTVGWLYGINTLGAALGALCATWWFLPQAGLSGSLKVAAGVNLVCVSIALSLVVRQWGESAVDIPVPAASADAAAVPSTRAAAADAIGERALPLQAWAALFGLSGFVALSLEIVWFRLLGIMLKSTAFTFGTLLGLYLTGIGLGAALGSAAARRVRRPALWFLVLQAGIGAYAALSLTLLIARLNTWPLLHWFADYVGPHEPLDIRSVVTHVQDAVTSRGGLASGLQGLPWQFVRLYVLLPAALVGPPTLMAGFGFPLLQRVVQIDLAQLGRRVGVMLAVNILGSTLGAFIAGWVFLDVLGTAGTLKLLVAMNATFAFLAVRMSTVSAHPRGRLVAYVATAVIVGGMVSMVPGNRALWARLHGTPPNRLIVAEDRSGLAVLAAEHLDFRRLVVFINGRSQSWIPYGDIHTVLGALPAFAHPHPRSAVLIGLGSGDSLYSMAGRADLDRIVSIEIIKPQLDALQMLAKQQGYPGVVGALDDRRVEHVFGDGRLYIRQAGRKYDIIEADALYPTSAYSGNLYSETYFELLRDHLNPGGYAVSWIPTERSARTFLKVFPYVWEHRPFMIGSNMPITFDRERMAERLSDRKVLDHFTMAGVNIRDLLAPYVTDEGREFDPSYDRSGLLDVNTDLFPRDEFDVPPLLTWAMFRSHGSH